MKTAIFQQDIAYRSNFEIVGMRGAVGTPRPTFVGVVGRGVPTAPFPVECVSFAQPAVRHS
jgi:hypothetical protein